MFTLGLMLMTLAPEPKDARPEPAAARLKRALEETTDVTFDKNTLEEVIAFFKNRTRSEIVLDSSLTGPGGVDPTQPIVSVSVRGGTYREALRKSLAPQQLHFAVVGDRILIGKEATLIARQLRQIVSIDSAATPLADLLKHLADDTGANIVLDPKQAEIAKGPIALKVDEVPLETAVRLAADIGGLRVVRLNNVLYVTSDAKAEKLRIDAESLVPAPPTNVTTTTRARLGNVVPVPAPVPPNHAP